MNIEKGYILVANIDRKNPSYLQNSVSTPNILNKVILNLYKANFRVTKKM